ncbi:MAG: hypothetical protein ABIQ17_07105, partial [Candidatus Limnocylindrales bacterium]
LLLVDGDLQRESSVVNVVAREVRALPEMATGTAGPAGPEGPASSAGPVDVRQLGHAGMRRLA